LNIVLFAHHNWGVNAIKVLQGSKHKVIRVYTHPLDMDKHEKLWYESVKNACEKYGIAVEEKTKVTEEDAETIRRLSPDVIFSIGWRKLIPKFIFDIPLFGTLNMHEGLLPRYRGFAPLNWAIINGETEIGITVHFVDKTADTGDIIIQKKIPIGSEDTAKDVYDRALELSPSLVLEALSLLESKTIKPICQSKLEKGFFCARRFPEDGRISWSQDRVKIYNLIRALSDPYPNAFCFHNNKKIYVKRAKLIEEDYRGNAGRICSIREDGIIVTCGSDHAKNQAILISEIATDEGIYKPKDFFKDLWQDLT